MEWYQVLTIVGANFLVFLGYMGTVIALHLSSDKKIDAIHDEMKQFHSRMCDIEARNKQKLEVRR